MQKGQIIGYVRVSTVEQNPERQLKELEPFHPDKIFSDFASGRSDNRPALSKLREYVREGDEIVVSSMDRLGRNSLYVTSFVQEIKEKGASIRFLKENLYLTPEVDNPINNLLIGIFASFAEFERSMIRESQLAGIKIAKKKGKYRRKYPLSVLEEAKKRVELGVPLAKVAREANIGRTTLRKFMKAQTVEKKEGKA